MESSAKIKNFGEWRDEVNARLQEIYCITIEDVDFDEEYPIGHWQSRETAFEFVEWYGNKYDLDSVTIYLPREQSR
jgi:hypothetical protein